MEHSRDSCGVSSSEEKESGTYQREVYSRQLVDSLVYGNLYQMGDFLRVKPSQAMEAFADNVQASSVGNTKRHPSPRVSLLNTKLL